MTPDKEELISDLEDIGFTVVTTQTTSSRWECEVVMETNPPHTMERTTGSTELEAIQAAHLKFWPEGREAAQLEIRAWLDGMGT